MRRESELVRRTRRKRSMKGPNTPGPDDDRNNAVTHACCAQGSVEGRAGDSTTSCFRIGRIGRDRIDLRVRMIRRAAASSADPRRNATCRIRSGTVEGGLGRNALSPSNSIRTE